MSANVSQDVAIYDLPTIFRGSPYTFACRWQGPDRKPYNLTNCSAKCVLFGAGGVSYELSTDNGKIIFDTALNGRQVLALTAEQTAMMPVLGPTAFFRWNVTWANGKTEPFMQGRVPISEV
jgi:hypothetical protein